MKSNTNSITMKNGTVKSGEFTYCRTPRVLKAYGSEYTIPVRTTEFEEKLAQAKNTISETVTASDSVSAIREGISLFIGADEVERIFPKDKLMEIDIDEILSFWYALNYEFNAAQNELIAKYRPAPSIRR
ncbi:MAG: hypothetical protein ACI4YB_09770 [Oscillospiraceae bacterium]